MKSFSCGSKKFFLINICFFFAYRITQYRILFEYEKKNIEKINIFKIFHKNTSHLAIHIFQTLQLFPNRSRVIRA